MTPFPWPADFAAIERRAIAHGHYIAVNAAYQYEIRQRFSAPPVVLAGPFATWADCCAALERLINPPAPLEFISLFAGIGGMDLGLERAGMRCVAQVEIDDYATRVLAKHWPAVARYRDVRECGASNLPPADLICGGFPCQDISNAGKRAGLAGERSGLWREFARIIGELRPRYVLVENVAALLNRGLSVVLGDLATLGYDAEWHCIPAAAVGAPHIRDRLFVVSYSRCSRQSGLQQIEGVGQNTPRFGDDGGSQFMADTHSAGLAQREGVFRNARTQLAAFERNCSTGAGQWAVEPAVGRVADGVPARVDRLEGLGNAVVPQVAEFIGKMIVDFDQSLPERINS